MSEYMKHPESEHEVHEDGHDECLDLIDELLEKYKEEGYPEHMIELVEALKGEHEEYEEEESEESEDGEEEKDGYNEENKDEEKEPDDDKVAEDYKKAMEEEDGGKHKPSSRLVIMIGMKKAKK